MVAVAVVGATQALGDILAVVVVGGTLGAAVVDIVGVTRFHPGEEVASEVLEGQDLGEVPVGAAAAVVDKSSDTCK